MTAPAAADGGQAGGGGGGGSGRSFGLYETPLQLFGRLSMDMMRAGERLPGRNVWAWQNWAGLGLAGLGWAQRFAPGSGRMEAHKHSAHPNTHTHSI